MITFQDFEKAKSKGDKELLTFLNTAITNHLNSDDYKIAVDADNYDHQKNTTISEYVRIIFSLLGSPIEDFTASNSKIPSNFFHRLNTQRNMYSLGKGVSFTDHKEEVVENGLKVIHDRTDEKMGKDFDLKVKQIGYNALIHKVCFGFWNIDKLHIFPFTEFVPLWDEDNGALRAGIRFWQIDKNKPMIVVLYEEDGYTKYKSKEMGMVFEEVKPKRAYQLTVRTSEADGEEIIGEDNYSGRLPIIPMWGSKLRQSTLVGMKQAIDSYDLIRSGFANDLSDCAQIYWIVENCGGMSDDELARFRDRLKINHIAVADTQNAGVKPYTQEIPHAARSTYLAEIRSQIYEDFGGLDVHTIAAGATNDHIDAAYQPLDEEADDYEYQVSEFIQQLLNLIGIEDSPVFKRDRISNQKEQTDMILSASDYLDDETILQKLPFIQVDEVANILAKKDEESYSRFEPQEATGTEEEQFEGQEAEEEQEA